VGGGGTTELTRPIPLYMQVVRQLRAQIASGEIAEGDVLPSQRQMMERWSISMQTASKVIGALKTEGLAIPSVGRDTIVAPGAATRIAAAAQGTAHASATAEPASSAAAGPNSVKAGKVAAPPHVAEVLAVPSGRRALRRTEVHGSDGEVSAVVVSWYPQAVADAAPRLAESQPLPAGALAYIAEVTGTRLRRVDERYSAEAAGEEVAEVLGVAQGSPVLTIRARLYDAEGNLVELTETTIPAGGSRSRTFTITGS
jgi:DNA-binding GntR family transcriptional regulator